MKQTIRIETFETNSSSYHTVSITKRNTKPLSDIEVGKKAIFDSNIEIKKIGYTESYIFSSRTKADKVNMLLRYLACDFWYNVYNYKEVESKVERGTEEFKVIYNNLFEAWTPVKALLDVIKDYTKAEVEIKYKDWKYPPYMEHICDDDCSDVASLIGLYKEDSNNYDKMYNKYKEIIFDDDIVINEECESNE